MFLKAEYVTFKEIYLHEMEQKIPMYMFVWIKSLKTNVFI